MAELAGVVGGEVSDVRQEGTRGRERGDVMEGLDLADSTTIMLAVRA